MLFSYHEITCESATHTYTALSFTPHDTLLHRLYEGDTTYSITVLQSRAWTPCLAYPSSVRCGYFRDANCLRVSLDGTRLTFGSSDFIFLWDARTTVERHLLNHDTDEDLSLFLFRYIIIAFSPKSSALAGASSPNGTLVLWDTTTSANELLGVLDRTRFMRLPSPQEVNPRLSVHPSIAVRGPLNYRYCLHTGITWTSFLLATTCRSRLDRRRARFISSRYPTTH